MNLAEKYIIRKKIQYLLALLPHKKKIANNYDELIGVIKNVLPHKTVKRIEEDLEANNNRKKGYHCIEEEEKRPVRSLNLIIEELIHLLNKKLEKVTSAKQSHHEKNIKVIGTLLGLVDEEIIILECLILVQIEDDLQSFVDDFSDRWNLRIFFKEMCLLTNLPQRKLRSRLSPDSILISSGILENENNHNNSFSQFFNPSDRVLQVSEQIYRNKTQLWNEFFNPVEKSNLKKDYFNHLESETKTIINLLQNAVEKKQSGVNILLYGSAGTGKTEFVKFVTRELRCTIYEVPSTESDGRKISKENRMLSLAMCNQALKTSDHSLIMFDESDTILNKEISFFSNSEDSRKPWLNRYLETNTVPTFWIVNESDAIESPIIRRFMYSMKFNSPDLPLRIQMWQQVLDHKKRSHELSFEEIECLAQQFEVSVGTIEMGVRAAALMSNGNKLSSVKLEAILEKSVQLQQQSILGVGKSHKVKKYAYQYDLSLLNTNFECSGLIRNVKSFIATPQRKRAYPNMSICLYGPSGTGKTKLANYIAEQVKKPLVVKRVSDLVSCYVGETEKNIANAFVQAQSQKAILLIDEVDSFLQSRENASKSWEVSQVNEFLTQMEQFEGVFIGSTNLMDNFDAASLRRFSLKIKFDYLNQSQCLNAFQNYFKSLLTHPELENAEIQKGLSKMRFLTPGDFQVVQQRNFYKMNQCSYKELLHDLEGEMSLKKEAPARAIGF